MMTLDGAIKHAEEVAEEQDKLCKRYDDASGYSRSHNESIRVADAKWCERCAKEHRQLAEWLKDYKRLKEQEPCEDAVSRKDMYFKLTNGAYPNETIEQFIDRLVKELEDMPPVTPTQRWIPVSERSPKPFEHVNCTCHSLIDDREDWVIETCYIPQPHDSPYSDWGNIPMLNSCECEVIAWTHRDIPEPYKAESEETK